MIQFILKNQQLLRSPLLLMTVVYL
nr:hypothetical protein [Lactococcus lactis]